MATIVSSNIVLDERQKSGLRRIHVEHHLSDGRVMRHQTKAADFDLADWVALAQATLDREQAAIDLEAKVSVERAAVTSAETTLANKIASEQDKTLGR